MDAVEFQRLAAGSRTYRRYGARPLRRDELLGLVEAARLAPTGNNSQQLRFRVVPGMEDPAGCQLVFSHLHWAASLPDWDGPEADERAGRTGEKRWQSRSGAAGTGCIRCRR